MKYVFAVASLGALLFSSACTQNPEKLMATANRYHQNKKYKEASILYQKVIAKDKTNAEAYYREGLNLIDERQPAQAIGYLRKAVDLKPSNTDAAVKLSEIYLAVYATDTRKFRTMLDETRELSAKISAHAPNSFESYRVKGLLALADNNVSQALEDFRKANDLRPYSPDLVGWYAQTLVAEHHQDQATALIQDMLAHNKTWGPGYDFLFLQYSRANDAPKAEATLRDRVKNDPASASAAVNLANYLLAVHRSDEGETVVRKLLDDPKAFPNAHQLVGDFYVRGKKYDQALEQYNAGVKEDPKQAVAYKERIVAVTELMGKEKEALVLAKELASKNPKETTANELYASLLLQRGTKADLTSSVNELKTLVQRNPSMAILHLDLAKGYFGLSNTDGALSESLEALRHDSHLLQAHLLAARIYNARGEFGKSIEQTENVLASEPANPEAHLSHAQALLGSGMTVQGQTELENLVTNFPHMNDARLQLASIYQQQKAPDKAQEQFQKVWTSNPPDIRGYVGLQSIKMSQGKVDDAVQAMRDIVQKNPKSDALRSELANFEANAASISAKSSPDRARQFAEAAIADLKTVLQTSPKYEDAWVRLGVLQRGLDQIDAAMASFEQAIAINPRNATAILNQALLLEATGKKKEAAAAYNKVLGIQPQNTLALNNLAFLNAESGQNLDQAMTLATKAQRQVPNSPAVSDTLGYVYFQKNLNSEALQIFRRVVQDAPQNPTFRLHLAMALLKKGDKQGARDEAEKAMKTAAPQQQDQIRSFVGQIG
ncbi:MAG TPA: tetratricopeptide repeat protein [Bryobacteraceae bacterium]|jgi:tetratricopeptide (TPR) repeat protein|nr:tetratricopeptide repeat protein [Bryobacteraceae bacterium]